MILHVQAEDEHPYALNTYLVEELNKLGIAYVHFIEPRAIHSMGVASPHAEFNFQRIDQNLDVSADTLILIFAKAHRTPITLIIGGPVEV